MDRPSDRRLSGQAAGPGMLREPGRGSPRRKEVSRTISPILEVETSTDIFYKDFQKIWKIGFRDGLGWFGVVWGSLGWFGVVWDGLGWLDGWMDGWMDGWTDGWADGRRDG